MSDGSDYNKLSIPPAVVPGISVDSRKRVTRANVKTALTASQIDLNKFIEVSDRSRANTLSPVSPLFRCLTFAAS